MACSSRLVLVALLVCLAATLPARARPAAALDSIDFVFALYFSPEPAADVDEALARLLQLPGQRLQLAGSPATKDALGTVKPRWVPLSDFALLPASSFSLFSVGVDIGERAKMAAASRVYVLEFTSPRRGALIVNRAACTFVAELAAATGGTIWDDETRQLYSIARWRQRRVDSWQGNLPLMSDHVTLHAYRDPELVRVVSLGMRKFGLPDLVMNQVPDSESRAAGNTLNALMQRLVEGGRSENGRLDLRLTELRHAAARQSALANPLEKAVGEAVVSLQPVKPEEGDAPNPLWEVDFPAASLPTVPERRSWGFSQLYGSTDTLKNVRAENPRMKAASDRARQEFFAQEARFRRGLAVGERLLVKKGFSAGGQTEYMWVEVTHWNDHTVDGILANDPYYVTGLHAGMRIAVSLDEVYDYLLYKPDGSMEGNETGKVLADEGE